MIRVGFLLRSSFAGWNGGINYYSNILQILKNNDCYTPVLLCAPELKNIVASRFSDFEVSYHNFLSYNSFSDKIRKCMLYTCSYEPFIDNTIRERHIDVISHNDRFPLNSNTKINSCSWIPDLQSFRLPKFQTLKATRRERLVWRQLIKNSTYVIVSSYDAKKDLLEMFPDTSSEKVKVLHFTVPPLKMEDIKNRFKTDMLSKYAVKPYSYYMISNQFWKHKNHIVVAKALHSLLKMYGDSHGDTHGDSHADGVGFKVIATGLTNDPRGMNLFTELNEYIQNNNLSNNFILTGDIPYADVQLLQHFSIAVIQPSFFEGWNTAVEECRAIGKKILLSNIPVHIEQAPINGLYFDPNNADELAKLMKDTADRFNPKLEKEIEKKAIEDQYVRWNEFSNQYIQILNETVHAK